MVEMEWAQASPEEIVELRKQFLQKYEANSNSGEFIYLFTNSIFSGSSSFSGF